MAEGLSWIKFFGSFFQALPWIKTIRIFIGILGISFIGLTIYRAYIMPTNKQVTQIVAESGSHVNLSQQTERRKWMEIHPFVEGYGFYESDNRKGGGVKSGVRVEF